MAKEIWKTKLHEVRPHADFLRDGGKPANYLDTFDVQADGSDDAKRAAKAFLDARGQKLRSIAIDASGAERTLVAYIEPKPKVTA